MLYTVVFLFFHFCTLHILTRTYAKGDYFFKQNNRLAKQEGKYQDESSPSLKTTYWTRVERESLLVGKTLVQTTFLRQGRKGRFNFAL
ncbi:hypothetical protein FKM82_001050 [Ascaphus truei]